jgi:hypothetical protein
MIRFAAVVLLLSGWLAPALRAQATGDKAGVERAALDYLEAFYQGDSTKFLRSVRPEFYKLGFWRPKDSTNYAAPEQMTWKEALDFIRGVKERKNFAPATAPKLVQILEVMNQTAAAKVTAWWGTDYLLMGKFDGRWMISHVLWQSPPATIR